LTKKYKKSSLLPEAGKEYLKKILYLIEVEKVYKESDISLKYLSAKLMISPRIISQVINEHLKKNFFELINYYRIKEAQEMLMDPEKSDYSITRISYEVGFNTKSAFNRVFKHFSKMTPSQFRKNNKGTNS
jgi:AraC-like DNA-binding protein